MMKEQCLRFFQKPRGNSGTKNNFGDIRKGYFVWRKDFFERVRLTTAKRKKKTEPKGEEKLKRFQREMKKENEKGD